MDFFKNGFQNLKKLEHKIGAETTEFDRFEAETRQKTRLQVKNQTLKSDSKNALPTSSKKSGFRKKNLEHLIFWRRKTTRFKFKSEFLVMLINKT